MGARSGPGQGKPALCVGRELGHGWPRPWVHQGLVISRVLPPLLSLGDWKDSFSLTPGSGADSFFLGFLCVLCVCCILKEVILSDAVNCYT